MDFMAESPGMHRARRKEFRLWFRVIGSALAPPAHVRANAALRTGER